MREKGGGGQGSYPHTLNGGGQGSYPHTLIRGGKIEPCPQFPPHYPIAC